MRNVHCLSITFSGTKEVEVLPAWDLLFAAPTVVLAQLGICRVSVSSSAPSQHLPASHRWNVGILGGG